MPRRRLAKTSVLILTASFGGPHRGTADALSRYLRTHHDQAVEVRVVDLFEDTMPSLNVLARFAYDRDAEFFPKGLTTWPPLVSSSHSSAIMTEFQNVGLARLAEMLAQYSPQVVISTFPVAGAAVAHLRPQVRPFLAATVLSEWSARHALLHPDTDLYFVSCREVRDELVVAGVSWDRVVVSGVPVLGGRECTPCAGAGGDSKPERFTVVIDAAGTVDTTARLVASMADLGIRVVVAPTSGDRPRRALESLVARSPLVTQADSSSAVPDALAGADVLLARAGSSWIAEAVATGCPTIIYTRVPAFETHNVDFLVNSGVALLSREDDDAMDKVRFLFEHPQRSAQMAECAARLGRSMAARTVCERVLAMA